MMHFTETLNNIVNDKKLLNFYYFFTYKYQVLPFENFLYKTTIQRTTSEDIKSLHFSQRDNHCDIYIHVPFCKNDCRYCDCARTANNSDITINRYLDKLIGLFDYLSEGIRIDNVWIGGGTPLMIDYVYLDKLLSKIRYKNNHSQIIIETTAAELTDKKIDLLIKHNVKRITIGVQTTNKQVLKWNNRQYDFDDIKKKVALLKNNGFQVNLDIITGLPNQSTEDTETDINLVCQLNPDEIHLFSFSPREPTKIKRCAISKEVILKREKSIKRAKALLIDNGYSKHDYEAFAKNYEVTNKVEKNHFGKNTNILALGHCAEGHINSECYYSMEFVDGDFEFYKAFFTTDLEIQKYIAMHLIEEINLGKFERVFNFKFEETYKPIINKLIENKILIRNKDSISFGMTKTYEHITIYYMLLKLFWSKETLDFVKERTKNYYNPNKDYSKAVLKEKIYYDYSFVRRKHDILY